MAEASVSNKTSKPVGTPWSSGRLLTSAERDRKRRMNRESQLLRRERMKERLRAFESRLGKVEENYDQLCRSKPTAQPPSQPYSQNLSQFAQAPTLVDPFALAERSFSDPRSIRITQTPSTANRPLLPSLVSKADQNTTMCDYLGEALMSVYSVDPLQVCTNDIHNQDALIRGVVRGWNDLQKESFNCPLWRILSWTDELLAARTAIATRLALLRGVHLMLMNIISPDRVPSLPRWFRPGKLQLSISHHVTCDYFAWPQFRERLIICDYPKLDDAFWSHFVRNFRFAWSSSPARTIEMDETSSKYRFSRQFLEATQLLQNFKMDLEFFEVYPATFDDVRVLSVP